MSLADDLRARMARLKPGRDSVRGLHNKFRTMTNKFDAPGPAMRSVKDFHISTDGHAVPVRLYTPMSASTGPGPAMVFIHGGGWVTCSIESHEGVALRIADSSGMRVISVDYRLAPDHPFPAALDDCEAVLNWALSGQGEAAGIDPSRLAVGGDSAGGNLSAYIAQAYRKQLKAQLLFYPVMQLAEVKPQKPGPQDMLQLGVVALKYINTAYVAGADTSDTRLSPLFEKDLIGVPPAYVLTCGLDPLRLEGKLYADHLEASGVSVMRRHEKAMVHGFLNFSRAFPPGKIIPTEAGQFLRKHMNPR